METAVGTIISALISGAAAAATDTAAKEVKEAFTKLRGSVKKRFKGVSPAEVALAEAEKDPETWEKPLAKAVGEQGLDKDEQILALARQVLELVEADRATAGKYNINIGKAQGVIIGDSAQVTQHFGDRPTENGGSSE